MMRHGRIGGTGAMEVTKDVPNSSGMIRGWERRVASESLHRLSCRTCFALRRRHCGARIASTKL